MPLTSNVYHIGRGINTISWHDCCDHTSSRVDSHEPYPALHTRVERSEEVSRDADELDEWYHSDALFGFTIAAQLEGIVEEQRRTSEDFKDQMSILVSKLLERDSNVRQSFETVEKRLNQHHFALNKAEDQVCLQVLQRSAMLLILPIVPGDERSGGLAIWSD